MSSDEQTHNENPSGTSGETEGKLSPSRRSLLTRGLIAGPVALTAMRPVKTLASTYYCNYSGWHSFKLNSKTSAHPKKGTKCGSGHQITHYSKNSKNWPKSCRNYSNSTVTISSTSTWSHIFGGSDSTKLLTYLQKGASNNQACFIAAVFNSSQISGYPLTAYQICEIWNNPSSVTGWSGVSQTQAALFFSQLDLNS
jgi:hypothetical protein